MSITARIDNITTLTDKYATALPPCPKSVKIEITGRCNFRCNFCAHFQRLRKVGDMDFEFFKRITKEMRQAGVEELGMFYLGESFLCKWLAEGIRYAKEECGYPYVFLTTNGSLSTVGKVEDCMKAGLDSLKFSLNYADEEQFAEIAQVKASLFGRIAENVEAARSVRDANGYKCGLYGSFIEYDAAQDTKMTEYLDKLRPFLDEVYALPLYNQAALVEKEGWEFIQGNRGRAGNLRPPLPCWSIFTEGHISSDGRLSACCFDHDNRFNMGDLTQVSFMDAWHSLPFQDLRLAHLRENVDGTICEKCVAL